MQQGSPQLFVSLCVHVELGKLTNIDLLGKGTYSIRCRCYPSQAPTARSVPPITSRHDTHIYDVTSTLPTASTTSTKTTTTSATAMARTAAKGRSGDVLHVHTTRPEHLTEGSLGLGSKRVPVGKPFRSQDGAQLGIETSPGYIRYQREGVHVDTAFTAFLSVPIDDYLSATPKPVVTISLDLLKTLSKKPPGSMPELACTRTIHVWGQQCIHRMWAHAVEFDFLHMCSVSTCVAVFPVGVVPSPYCTLPTAMLDREESVSELEDKVSAFIGSQPGHDWSDRVDMARERIIGLFLLTINVFEATLVPQPDFTNPLRLEKRRNDGDGDGNDNDNGNSHGSVQQSYEQFRRRLDLFSQFTTTEAHTRQPHTHVIELASMLMEMHASGHAAALELCVGALAYNKPVWRDVHARALKRRNAHITQGSFYQRLELGHLVMPMSAEFEGFSSVISLAKSIGKLNAKLGLSPRPNQEFRVLEDAALPQDTATVFLQLMSGPLNHVVQPHEFSRRPRITWATTKGGATVTETSAQTQTQTQTQVQVQARRLRSLSGHDKTSRGEQEARTREVASVFAAVLEDEVDAFSLTESIEKRGGERKEDGDDDDDDHDHETGGNVYELLSEDEVDVDELLNASSFSLELSTSDGDDPTTHGKDSVSHSHDSGSSGNSHRSLSAHGTVATAIATTTATATTTTATTSRKNDSSLSQSALSLYRSFSLSRSSQQQRRAVASEHGMLSAVGEHHKHSSETPPAHIVPVDGGTVQMRKKRGYFKRTMTRMQSRASIAAKEAKKARVVQVVRECDIRGTLLDFRDIGQDDFGEGHLFVCVHGLDGNEYDLRNVRLQLEQLLPQADFLMSSVNDSNTKEDIFVQAANLLGEVEDAISEHSPTHVSFLAHSLGTVIVRALLTNPKFAQLVDISPAKADSVRIGESRSSKPCLHAFVAFCAPHCGALYLSPLLSTGMWVLRKFRRARALDQLMLKDARNPRETALYQLSAGYGLNAFRYVVCTASPQDAYVNLSSALLTPPQRSSNSNSSGGGSSGGDDKSAVYEEMRTQLLEAITSNKHTQFIRCQVVFHEREIANMGLSSVIGRAAHVAMLDSIPFVRKFLLSTLQCYLRTPSLEAQLRRDGTGHAPPRQSAERTTQASPHTSFV